MANMVRLGRRLRSLREAAGLTQVELAKETRISQNYISAVEMAKIASPGMELLCELGRRFGLTPNEICTVAGWWTPPRKASKMSAELEWSIERLQELPKSEQAMLTTVIRQMVSAAYREARGHAPPPLE